MTRGTIRTKLYDLIAALPAFAYTTPAGVSAPNVFKAQMEQIPPERLPAASIYFSEEDVEASRKGAASRTLHRDATFVVEILQSNEDPQELEASLDTLTGLVEAALTADNTLTGLTRAIDVKSVAYDRDMDPEAEIYIGAAVMTFTIWYDSTEGA